MKLKHGQYNLKQKANHVKQLFETQQSKCSYLLNSWMLPSTEQYFKCHNIKTMINIPIF